MSVAPPPQVVTTKDVCVPQRSGGKIPLPSPTEKLPSLLWSNLRIRCPRLVKGKNFDIPWIRYCAMSQGCRGEKNQSLTLKKKRIVTQTSSRWILWQLYLVLYPEKWALFELTRLSHVVCLHSLLLAPHPYLASESFVGPPKYHTLSFGLLYKVPKA